MQWNKEGDFQEDGGKLSQWETYSVIKEPMCLKAQVQEWPWRSEGGDANSYLTKSAKHNVTATQPWTAEWRGQTRQCLLLRQLRYSSPVKTKADPVTTIRRHGHWELYNCALSMNWNSFNTTVLGMGPNERWEGQRGGENGLTPLLQDNNHPFRNVVKCPCSPTLSLCFSVMWYVDNPTAIFIFMNFLISRNLPDSYILS